ILETTHPLLSTKTYDVSSAASIKIISNSGNVPVPTARSVYETGSISLPASVSGFIIYIPDEAHHSISEHKTISLKNAHFIPSNLTVPAGTSLVYMHGDPNHIHIEILKDAKSGQTVWQTVPIKHPGSSDAKVLPIGTYAVTDQKYKNMTGTINVSGKDKASSNNLVAGVCSFQHHYYQNTGQIYWLLNSECFQLTISLVIRSKRILMAPPP